MKFRNELSLVAALLVIDRLIKVAALEGLLHGSFLGFGYPRFTFHKNYGIAFDLPVPAIVTVTVSAIILVVLVSLLARAITNSSPRRFALLLIVAGAASNLYDRLQFGFVIDAIELVPMSVWNIADGLILAGILLLLRAPRRRSPPTLDGTCPI